MGMHRLESSCIMNAAAKGEHIAFIGAGFLGRLDAFEKDGNIPLKYGMDQCAGVIMYAQHAKI